MTDNSNDTGEADSALSFLALGDSYTIGESVEEEERWPFQLVEYLNEQNVEKFGEPDIIARTGWRTDELIEAIDRADPRGERNLVSLLIGVNNQYQGRQISTYRTEFRQLLETAITLAGNSSDRVMVVSIPDYGFTPFGAENKEKISREIDEYNSINRELATEYGVMYVNITDISRSDDPDLVAADNLHPSAEQYRRWVERIVSTYEFRESYLP